MNLSQNFTLEEMLRSGTARRLGINEQFDPPADIIENLRLLCINILEPLRKEVGPIKVNSGWRCPRLNKAVGGAKNSQHLTGEAADIECINYSNALIFQKAQKLVLPFDQLIWEYGTKKEPEWVHISFGARNRRQVLWIPNNLKP